MSDIPYWERYSLEISPDRPLDTTKSRGCAIIYAPEIAQSLGLDKHTLLYFSWSITNAVFRIYHSESVPPERLDTSSHGYRRADVSRRTLKGITLPNRHRPDLNDSRYWYNYIQVKKKQWFAEESNDKAESSDLAVQENKVTDDNMPGTYTKPSRPSNGLSGIQSYLVDHKSVIRDYFCTTDDQWRELTEYRKRPQAEKVLTFLMGCGYALGREQGLQTLTKVLTGSVLKQPNQPMIWFEAQPIPPRMKEGNTHLDLALGAIARREGTANGIRFDTSTPSWICFCEAKVDSDISPRVKYDPNRNQLARVIENAICFQNSGKYPNDVYVTIIAPKAFSHKRPLLEKKFSAYKSNPKSLLHDLNQCRLPKRAKADWLYPYNIAERITKSLKLQWVCFEDLVENLPDSDISGQIRGLWDDIM